MMELKNLALLLLGIVRPLIDLLINRLRMNGEIPKFRLLIGKEKDKPDHPIENGWWNSKISAVDYSRKQPTEGPTA